MENFVIEGRVLSDDRDVGTVKRRDKVDVFARLTEHLPRDPGARGMRDCVMTMQQLQLMRPDDFVHPYRQSEIVWRKLEEGIAPDVDLVKKDARQKRRKPKGLTVGDEVDFVSSVRQRNSELCRDGSRPTVRRITRNSYLHSALSHHSLAMARARES